MRKSIRVRAEVSIQNIISGQPENEVIACISERQIVRGAQLDGVIGLTGVDVLDVPNRCVDRPGGCIDKSAVGQVHNSVSMRTKELEAIVIAPSSINQIRALRELEQLGLGTV